MLQATKCHTHLCFIFSLYWLTTVTSYTYSTANDKDPYGAAILLAELEKTASLMIFEKYVLAAVVEESKTAETDWFV